MVKTTGSFGGREFFMRQTRRWTVVVFIIAFLWYWTAILGKADVVHAWDSLPSDMADGFRSQVALRAFLSVMILFMAAISIFIESLILRFIMHLETPEPELSIPRSALIVTLAYVPWVIVTMAYIYTGWGENIMASTVTTVVFVVVHAVCYWAMASSKQANWVRSLVALFLVCVACAVFAIPQFV